MDKKKLHDILTERQALKENIKSEFDDRIDELLSSTLKTKAGKLRGSLGATAKRIKRDVIGTADDYRFGYRKGYMGASMKAQAKRDAMVGGVIDPNTGERVVGDKAWDIAQRRMADRRLKSGIPTWSDQWKMNAPTAAKRDEFARDYELRQGRPLPGFTSRYGDVQRTEVDPDTGKVTKKTEFGFQPGKQQTGTAGKYMNQTTPDRIRRRERQQAQAKRLAGDPDTIATFRAAARAKGWGGEYKQRPGDRTDPSYPYTTGTPETQTVRTRKPGETDFRDIEVGTGRMKRPTGISKTGRPISRGGVPWWQQGRTEAPQEVEVERMPPKEPKQLPGTTRPKIARGADDPVALPPGTTRPQISRGADDPAALPSAERPLLTRGPNRAERRRRGRKARQKNLPPQQGSMGGASVTTAGGRRSGVKGAGGRATRSVQPRGIGASTELVGPRLSEMMQKRLNNA